MPIALALVVALSAVPVPQVERPCGFALTQVTTTPRITGAPEVTSRTRVLEQSDSPLRVLAVDVTEATFGEPAGGMVRFEVANISDRPIKGGSLEFRWRTSGYASMWGMAVFNSTLKPREAMFLDARLAGPKSPTVTPTSVIVSVRSVTFDECTYEPAQPVSVVPGTQVLDIAGAGDACRFTAAASDEPPIVKGAPEVLARVRVASQPASPLQVTGVDLSQLHVNVGEGWIQLRGSYTIEVQNVGDVSVDRAAVSLDVRPPAASRAALTMMQEALGPGKRRRLTQKVARIDDLPASEAPAGVLLVAAVERLTFGRCTYIPARSYPKAGAQ